ncbi:MAG: short-chain fatty acid transporter [Infirmifilum sp.]
MGTLERYVIEPLKEAGWRATQWTEKYIPDAWIIAVTLTLVTFLLAWIWGSPPGKPWWGLDGLYHVIIAWGNGFWILLTFAMQMTLIMLLGYILAVSPPIAKFMDWLARKPNPEKPWQSILLMGLWSNITGWINWGLSISSSAMFMTYIVRHQPKVDFRLLVATAYLGLGTTWHSGLSGSAPLLIATPNNFLIQTGVLKEVIPITRTILSPFNLILASVIIILTALVMAAMTPRPERAYKMTPEILERLKRWEPPQRPQIMTTAEKLSWWPGWNIIIFLMGLTWLVDNFAKKGFAGLTLDVVNFIFLMLGIIFHYRPVSFLKAAAEGARFVWGIIIQFPFYAGIFGMINYTALAQTLTNFFIAISTPQTYLLIVYWYSGILNYLVPSGGSKWVIESPYILKAGFTHGISDASIVMAYAWGDMATDMIQPFWAIPLLGVSGLEFREIMGYLMVLFIIYSVVLTIAMLIMPINL